ncbi:fimbria/pilus outer membrane usher protein [Shigella flexneri]
MASDGECCHGSCGYAPQISGIARTNAAVDRGISQSGRVIYQKKVPPGPFIIDDLNQYLQAHFGCQSDGRSRSGEQFSGFGGIDALP